MNEEQCRSVLVELGSAFPKSKPLGTMEDQIGLWMRHFRPVDMDDMIKAVLRLIDRETFFPTIKEFGKYLQMVTDKPLPTSECQCDGLGYYEVTKGQWIPCPGCLPVTNRRWAEGHFAKGHWCEECSRSARGDGQAQTFDEHQRAPNRERKLTVEENLDRLRIMQQLVKEIAVARAADPGRYKRLSRAQIDKHWEDRFNALMQEGSEVDPVVVELFNADPGVLPDGEEIL
jgi:hypothetical protein